MVWQAATNTREEIRGTVGKKWYRNFRKRHPIIADKYVVKYGVKRSKWVTMDNLKFMYHHTYNYNELVKAGIGVEEEKYVLDGCSVGSEFGDTRLGNITEFQIIHPMYLLFADEVGSNTNAE